MKSNILIILLLIKLFFAKFPFGVGYSDDSQQIKTVECFVNDSFNVVKSKTITKFNKMRYEEIKRLFLSSDNIDSGYELYEINQNIDVLNRFYEKKKQTEKTLIKDTDNDNLIIDFDFFALHRKLVNFNYDKKGKEALTSTGKHLYSFDSFGFICGNNVITSIELGAILIIKMRFFIENINDSILIQNYIKKIQAQEPESTFTNEVTEELASVINKNGIKGNLSLSVLQIGGDAQLLHNALEKNESGQYFAIHCDFLNMNNCKQALDGMITYAKEAFLPSVERNNEMTINKLIHLNNKFSKEPITILGLDKPKSLVTKEIKEIREKLEKIYLESKEIVEYLTPIVNEMKRNKSYKLSSTIVEVYYTAENRLKEFNDTSSEAYQHIKQCYDNLKCDDANMLYGYLLLDSNKDEYNRLIRELEVQMNLKINNS